MSPWFFSSPQTLLTPYRPLFALKISLIASMTFWFLSRSGSVFPNSVISGSGKSGSGKVHGFQEMLQQMPFFSEFPDDFRFFALSCSSNFCSLKAISFYSRILASRYAVWALNRNSSSRSDSFSSFASTFFSMEDSFGGRLFFSDANPSCPSSLYFLID